MYKYLFKLQQNGFTLIHHPVQEFIYENGFIDEKMTKRILHTRPKGSKMEEKLRFWTSGHSFWEVSRQKTVWIDL